MYKTRCRICRRPLRLKDYKPYFPRDVAEWLMEERRICVECLRREGEEFLSYYFSV